MNKAREIPDGLLSFSGAMVAEALAPTYIESL